MGTSTGDHLWVSHLLFANDTLVLCDADIDQMLFLHLILLWFEIVSGLKINLDKFELVPVGVVPSFEMLVDALGCNQGSLPMKYLGLSLGAKWKDYRPTKAVFYFEKGNLQINRIPMKLIAALSSISMLKIVFFMHSVFGCEVQSYLSNSPIVISGSR